MTEALAWAIALDFGIFLAIAFPLTFAGVLSFAPARTVNFLVPAGTLIGGYVYVTAYAALGPAAGLVAVAAAGAFVLLASLALQACIPWPDLSTRFMVATFGLFFIVTNLASIVYGDEALVAAPPSYRTIPIGGATIPQTSVLVIGLSILCCGSVFLALRATRLGLQLRAMFEDLDLARNLGLSGRNMLLVCFGLAGGLAGLSGVLLVTESHIAPSLGLSHFLIALSAVLASAGGVTRMAGVLVGLAVGRQIVIVAFGLDWEPALSIVVVLAALALVHYRTKFR